MPPKDFTECVNSGGRVRTKTLSGGRYLHICFKNGRSYAGETKTSKESSSKKSNVSGEDIIRNAMGSHMKKRKMME